MYSDFDIMNQDFINETYNLINEEDPLYCDEVLEVTIYDIIEVLHLKKSKVLEYLDISDGKLNDLMRYLNLKSWSNNEIINFTNKIHNKINSSKFMNLDSYSQSLIYTYVKYKNIIYINQLLVYSLKNGLINEPNELLELI